MESPIANVNTTTEADELPKKKRVSEKYKNCGRKGTIFKDGKPVDPKYYVNYYHDVIKKKETLCPYCDRLFACQRNLNRHLYGGTKETFCHKAYKRSQNPEAESESSSFDDFLRPPMVAPIREGSRLHEYIRNQTHQPKSEAEWFQAGWAMINMLLQAQKEDEN